MSDFLSQGQFAGYMPVDDNEGWLGPEGSYGTPGQNMWSQNSGSGIDEADGVVI